MSSDLGAAVAEQRPGGGGCRRWRIRGSGAYQPYIAAALLGVTISGELVVVAQEGAPTGRRPGWAGCRRGRR